MESRIKILGHPVHPMLIVFPLGLFATAVIFDIIYLVSGEGNWTLVAFYMIGAGVVGALLAAVTGILEWRHIPKSRARRLGLWHGLLNGAVVTLFAISWVIRSDAPAAPDTLALLLSFAGAVVSLIAAWLGGELVYRLRVGVDDEANLDASPSI